MLILVIDDMYLVKLPSDECNWILRMISQVMAWCHQATSHYLSQCWPRSMSPYGVIRPQWVKWFYNNQIPSPKIQIACVAIARATILLL